MEVRSLIGLGVKAKWRAGLRKNFAAELRNQFSDHALDLLADEAIVCMFSNGRRPRYGETEYLINRLKELHRRLEGDPGRPEFALTAPLQGGGL